MPIKVHSAIFVELTNHSSFPESSHSTFFLTSFNDDCKAQLSRGGPRDSFAPLVEWVLVSNNSPFTIGPAKDRLTSPAPDSEPSLPLPRWAEQESEPTTADEPYGATVLRIALKLEPNISDQVQEPATVLATGENTMDSESAEGSSAPCLRVSRAHWTILWIYMQTCPLFSHLFLNCLPALNYLPVLKRPWRSFPYRWHSQC